MNPHGCKTREKIIEIISDHLGLDPKQCTPNSHISNDLGADSLDVIEIAMALEEAFDILIPDDEAYLCFKTIDQCVIYIEQLVENHDVIEDLKKTITDKEVKQIGQTKLISHKK